MVVPRFAEAWIFLAAARAAVCGLPFRRVLQLWGLSQQTSTGREPLASPSPRARRLSGAVSSAARRTPWRSLCLEQALALALMLRMRGLPHALVLGAASGEGGDPMRAHAWLLLDEQVLIGGSGSERFTALGRFAWPRAAPSSASGA